MQALAELSLELMDSVQFIYELAFAKRELESLGVKFELRIDGGARFFAVNASNTDRLVKRSAYFKRVGNRLTDYARARQVMAPPSILFLIMTRVQILYESNLCKFVLVWVVEL